MNAFLKIQSILGLIVSFTTVSQATTPFTIETKGGQVCRTQEKSPEICMPSALTLGHLGLERIELIDRIQSYNQYLTYKRYNPNAELTLEQFEKAGGALFLTEPEMKRLTDSYRRLSVRNLSWNSDWVTEKDGFYQIPFFASLYWKGAWKMEGTLHVEGFIKIPTNHQDTDLSELNDLPALRQKISKAIQISGFADSTTEQKIEALRFLEQVARSIHFTVIGTEGQTVDAATLTLLKETVGPMVFAEVVYIPTIKTFLGAIGAISTTFNEVLRKIFEGLFQ